MDVKQNERRSRSGNGGLALQGSRQGGGGGGTFFLRRRGLFQTKDWSTVAQQLLTSVPRRVACEPVSLMSSHTIPGQHSQPTSASLSTACVRVYLLPATSTLGRMYDGVFYVLQRRTLK